MQGAIRLDHFAQRAVDAKSHTGMALIRFDMDITRPIARSLGQQGIEHADDGRIVCGF